MLVRKVTIIRPGRNRRAQSQRTSAKSTSKTGHTLGGGIFTRASASRTTLSSVFQLKSSPAKTDSRTPARSRREQTCDPGRQNSFLLRDPGRQSGVPSAERHAGSSGQATPRFHDSPNRGYGQQSRGDRDSNRHPPSTDLGRHFLIPLEPVSVARSGLPFRHVGSSLKESDLTKPDSDLPFTRADLPVRHSSLPAKRPDSPQPQPLATSSPPPGVFFQPAGPGPSGLPPRHCSLPHRYLDLPRSHLDYPLRRPDSEQAYRKLAEQEQLHRSLIASMCLARDCRSSGESSARSGGLLSLESQAVSDCFPWLVLVGGGGCVCVCVFPPPSSGLSTSSRGLCFIFIPLMYSRFHEMFLFLCCFTVYHSFSFVFCLSVCICVFVSVNVRLVQIFCSQFYRQRSSFVLLFLSVSFSFFQHVHSIFPQSWGGGGE